MVVDPAEKLELYKVTYILVVGLDYFNQPKGLISSLFLRQSQEILRHFADYTSRFVSSLHTMY